MLSFAYSLFLKLFYPTSLALLLLLVSAAFGRRHAARSLPRSSPVVPSSSSPVVASASSSLLSARIYFWLAIAVLLVCGNGWVVKYSTRYLERRYPSLDSQLSSFSPQPYADCILVLGGGYWDKIPPRVTVEVGEEGDRVLYAVHLFRDGKAPRILCTSGIAMGGIGPRPGGDVMAEFLENLGVPATAIIRETGSRNTHEHAEKVYPMLQEKGFKRVLLVTSATHMPRSMGVFRKLCPGIEFIPAPTDFRIVDMKVPWYRQIFTLIPTPTNYAQFSETMHEYLGMAWYRLRGWM